MRTLVVENVERLAKLIVQGLHKQGFDAEYALDATAAKDLLAGDSYDAMILDLGLPDCDGIEFLQQIRAEGSKIAVLILTARIRVADRVAGLDAGADDYLTKPFANEELCARLRALLRRSSGQREDVIVLGNLRFSTSTRLVEVGGVPASLSRRETTLLWYLLRQAGQVVQRFALEERIFGGTNTSANALEVLVHRLRQKLYNADADVSLHTIRGVGYLLAKATPT